jgi:transposase
VKVNLFSHDAYAYVVCDIKRRAEEITRFFIEAKEDGVPDDEINRELQAKGIFIIISSSEIPKADVLPLYYTRQKAENLFGISKNFLDLLPLRTHSVETFRGYLMLTFLSLIVYIEYKKTLAGKYAVDEALMEMSNLMRRIYDDKLIVSEPTKKMKEIISLISSYGG